jgi:hypothetical protein
VLTDPTRLVEATSAAASVQRPEVHAPARELRPVNEDPLRAATGICIGIALAFVMWTAVAVSVLLALR